MTLVMVSNVVRLSPVAERISALAFATALNIKYRSLQKKIGGLSPPIIPDSTLRSGFGFVPFPPGMTHTPSSLDRIIDFIHGSEDFLGLKGAIRVEEKLLIHQSGLCGLRKPSHELLTLGHGHGTLLVSGREKRPMIVLVLLLAAFTCFVNVALVLRHGIEKHSCSLET
jgi:hypothetical protein